jgi:hypothetical protein
MLGDSWTRALVAPRAALHDRGMRRTPTIAALCFVSCAVPLAAQGAEPEALVQQLADAGTRESARQRLIAMGSAAVPALAEALATAADAQLLAMLGIAAPGDPLLAQARAVLAEAERGK